MQSLLELNTSSSVAFKNFVALLTQLQQDTKGNIMDIFLLLPLVVGVLIIFFLIFILIFLSFSVFLVVIFNFLFLFLGLLL